MGWPQVVLTAALVMIAAWLIGALGERLLRRLARGLPLSSSVLSAIHWPARLLMPLMALHATLHGAGEARQVA